MATSTELSSFCFFHRDIVVREVPSAGGSSGLQVWDSSLVLARWLEQNFNENAFDGLEVLEVGAGCGLVGLLLASLGANVVLTDRDDGVIANLRGNIRANVANFTKGSATVRQMAWGEHEGIMAKLPFDKFDMIVGCDLVYLFLAMPFEHSGPKHPYRQLLSTIKAVSGVETTALLVQEHRGASESEFFEEFDRIFVDTDRVAIKMKAKPHHPQGVDWPPESRGPSHTIYTARGVRQETSGEDTAAARNGPSSSTSNARL